MLQRSLITPLRCPDDVETCCETGLSVGCETYDPEICGCDFKTQIEVASGCLRFGWDSLRGGRIVRHVCKAYWTKLAVRAGA